LRRVGPPALSSVAAWCFSLNLHWASLGPAWREEHSMSAG
jgi:hypothetical protein